MIIAPVEANWVHVLHYSTLNDIFSSKISLEYLEYNELHFGGSLCNTEQTKTHQNLGLVRHCFALSFNPQF